MSTSLALSNIVKKRISLPFGVWEGKASHTAQLHNYH